MADDTGRVALIDTPTIDNLGTGEVQLLRYQYSNHLSTATLELDDAGDIISYEEYYPYGTTSFQSGRSTAEVALKRYRYTGKERDEETGFNYHGARYYVPWLCRWAASEPINSEWYNANAGQPGRNNERQLIEFTASGYEYCYDNPVRFVDLSGEQVPQPYKIPNQDNVRVNNYRTDRPIVIANPDLKGTFRRNRTYYTIQPFRSSGGEKRYKELPAIETIGNFAINVDKSLFFGNLYDIKVNENSQFHISNESFYKTQKDVINVIMGALFMEKVQKISFSPKMESIQDC